MTDNDSQTDKMKDAEMDRSSEYFKERGSLLGLQINRLYLTTTEVAQHREAEKQ